MIHHLTRCFAGSFSDSIIYDPFFYFFFFYLQSKVPRHVQPIVKNQKSKKKKIRKNLEPQSLFGI